MFRKIIIVLVLFLVPSIAWSDGYVLVMSKDDNVCQHMLKTYNDDLKKHGQVTYEKHEEFNWIKWEDKPIRLRPDSEPNVTMGISAKITFFDINNDSKDEVVVYSEGSLSNHPTDNYDIFHYADVGMLDDIADGAKYQAKALKSLSSADGVAVNIYDINENNIKKLSKQIRYFISGVKERGDKNLHFIGWSDKISFLRLKKHYYISFEGPRTIGPNESFDKVEHYSVISELQKDNTLKNQCLYLIKEDKPSKGRTK